jgi:hypothetical protein
VCFTSPSSCCDCNIVVFPFYYSIPANWQPYWLLHIQIEAATGFPLMSTPVLCHVRTETSQNTRSPIPFDWLSCGSSRNQTKHPLTDSFWLVELWVILSHLWDTPAIGWGFCLRRSVTLWRQNSAEYRGHPHFGRRCAYKSSRICLLEAIVLLTAVATISIVVQCTLQCSNCKFIDGSPFLGPGFY